MNNKCNPVAGILSRWLVLILLFFSGPLMAQEPVGLQVGDTLPDVEIQHPVRVHTEPLRTGELYKDGLLLLNFWATWCVPCVKEMELLAEQLEEHKGRFRVLGVAYEPAATVARFLEKHPRIAESDIEIITDDDYFSKLFFHQTLPHNVWVDGDGVVQAVTGGEAVTAKNIAGMISGNSMQLEEKREVPFNMSKPLHVPDSLIEFRAIFQKDVPGLYMSGSTISISGLGRPNMQRFFGFNLLIKDLVWLAHQMPGLVANAYLMEIHTADSSRFFWPGEGKDPETYTGISRSEWSNQNLYSYELRTPKPVEDSLFFSHVIADLELNLAIKTRRELRSRQLCYVTYNAEAVSLDAAQTDEKYHLGVVGNELVIRNVPMDRLLHWLAKFAFGMGDRPSRREPYINHTGVDFPINATVALGDNQWDYLSYEHLEKCFTQQLGLQFDVSEGQYLVLVIEDR